LFIGADPSGLKQIDFSAAANLTSMVCEGIGSRVDCDHVAAARAPLDLPKALFPPPQSGGI